VITLFLIDKDVSLLTYDFEPINQFQSILSLSLLNPYSEILGLIDNFSLRKVIAFYQISIQEDRPLDFNIT